MKEFETYVFDLDGTLLETLKDLAASTNYALRTHNMPEHSIEDVRMFVGNGVKKLMERAIPNGIENPQFEDVYATFRQHYLEHNLDTTKPYEGIPELLAELKARGKILAIVSNKFYAATQELARHHRSGYWRARKYKEEASTRHRDRSLAPIRSIERNSGVYWRQRCRHYDCQKLRYALRQRAMGISRQEVSNRARRNFLC